jgi:hypothetical protein
MILLTVKRLFHCAFLPSFRAFSCLSFMSFLFSFVSFSVFLVSFLFYMFLPLPCPSFSFFFLLYFSVILTCSKWVRHRTWAVSPLLPRGQVLMFCHYARDSLLQRPLRNYHSSSSYPTNDNVAVTVQFTFTIRVLECASSFFTSPKLLYSSCSIFSQWPILLLHASIICIGGNNY